MLDSFLFLPGDLLIDILAKLPIKTIVRCTSVCKSWYSLLTNSIFIAEHLNFNRSNNNHLLLLRSYSDSDDQEHYSLHDDDNVMFSKYAELDFPLKKNKFDHYFRLIGSCNGLICLSNDQFGYHLFLWNPSIRKMMILPPVRVTFQSHAPHMCSIGFGFGFDSITGDYKVVRMVHFDQFNKPPEIHIFNLCTGTWRNISHVALPHIIINERAPQAFLKGAAHWIASESRSYGRSGFLIVSFHMGDEKFGQIMLPHNIMAHANHFNHLLMQSALYFRVAKLQESLALIHLTGSRDNTCCIWRMEEYGVAESWTKLFSIDMTGSNSVVGFTREGQILVARRDGYLVAYDPEADDSNLVIHGSKHSTYRHSFYAEAYTESLVLLEKRFCVQPLVRKSPGAEAGVVEGRSGAKKSRTGL